jgi:hypothetical protein
MLPFLPTGTVHFTTVGGDCSPLPQTATPKPSIGEYQLSLQQTAECCNFCPQVQYTSLQWATLRQTATPKPSIGEYQQMFNVVEEQKRGDFPGIL